MALNPSDRRRLSLATALTLVALPALWWANQGDGPNVATVGLDAGVVAANPGLVAADEPGAVPAPPEPAAEASPAAAPEPVAAAEVAPLPHSGPDLPTFMGGPVVEDRDQPVIAVSAAPGDRSTIRATFRRNVGSESACTIPGVVNGITVTVVNLSNNRTTTCTTLVAPLDDTEMVMHPERFATIADLTNAPIHVEIRR
jgi:hypothetical protein